MRWLDKEHAKSEINRYIVYLNNINFDNAQLIKLDEKYELQDYLNDFQLKLIKDNEGNILLNGNEIKPIYNNIYNIGHIIDGLNFALFVVIENKDEIKIIDYISSNYALFPRQGKIIKNQINYNSNKIILDFKGVELITINFLYVIMEGFIGKIKDVKELSTKLKIINYTDLIKLIYEDVYTMLKEKIHKIMF